MSASARIFLIVLAASIAAAPAAGGGAVTKLAVSPGSRIWLEGTTNVNAAWSCRGERIEGAMELDAPGSLVLELVEGAVATGELETAGARLRNPRLRLGIPVADLACGNRAMERDLRKALRAAEHPEIVYEHGRVTELEPIGEAGAGPHRFGIDVEGDLALAGSERRLRSRVVGERLARGVYRVTGELHLRMTDFGIEPPTALLGLVEASDRLSVRFDLRLALSDPDRTSLTLPLP